MKAAVMYPHESVPRYADIPDPVVIHEDDVLITVNAVAIKHVGRSRASGTPYSSETTKEARVIGGDGVGRLANGTRVHAGVAVTDGKRLVVIINGWRR